MDSTNVSACVNSILLSVIVPVFNVERYLSDCLNSLLDQGIDPSTYEIICVNDGSTDGSQAILEKYASKYPNVILVNQENAGVSAARNHGLDVARGEFVHFVDADDYLKPNTYAVLLAISLEYNADVCVFGHCEKVPEDSRYTNQINAVVAPHSYIWRNQQISTSACRNLIRRELIDKSKLRFCLGMKYGEDLLFEDHLALSVDEGKVVGIVESFYLYRQREGASFQNTEESVKTRAMDMLKSAQILKEYQNKHALNEKQRTYIETRISECTAAALFYALRCRKGLAREMLRSAKNCGTYPFSKLFFKGKKKTVGNVIMFLTRYRLCFWFFDTFNSLRK